MTPTRIIFYLTSLALLPFTTSQCLSKSEATSLASNHLSSLSTDSTGRQTNAALVKTTYDPKRFEWYDEDAVICEGTLYNCTLQGPKPLFTHRDQVASSAPVNPKYVSTTNDRYVVLDLVVGCESVVVRWRYSGVAKKPGGDPRVGVAGGTVVSYKGVDILTVNRDSRLVGKVVSTSDRFSYWKGIGYDALAGLLK